MAGPVPAIHVFANKKDVDARDKRGHDGELTGDIAQLEPLNFTGCGFR